MAKAEIDSFILKFKNLLLAGSNATLVIKSNAGKAEVSLNVVLAWFLLHLLAIKIIGPVMDHQDNAAGSGELKLALMLLKLKKLKKYLMTKFKLLQKLKRVKQILSKLNLKL